MKKEAITKVAKNFSEVVLKNSPSILTGVAVIGLGVTVGLAIDATPKAIGILIREDEMAYGEDGEFYFRNGTRIRDVCRLVWPVYISTAISGAATIGCVIGSNSISLSRHAALASIYTLTDTAFKEYKSKVADTFGKNKELKLRDEISADRIKANPPTSNEIIFTGKGETLFYDSLSGRYFNSDMDHIKRAVIELNRNFIQDGFASVNDFYYEIGLPNIKLGDKMGWDVDYEYWDISYTAHLSENNIPCIALNYRVEPRFI